MGFNLGFKGLSHCYLSKLLQLYKIPSSNAVLLHINIIVSWNDTTFNGNLFTDSLKKPSCSDYFKNSPWRQTQQATPKCR